MVSKTDINHNYQSAGVIQKSNAFFHSCLHELSHSQCEYFFIIWYVPEMYLNSSDNAVGSSVAPKSCQDNSVKESLNGSDQ